MKIILKCFLVQLVLLPSISAYAQIGIGTTSPDTSSILDISSVNKGFLMPRLTTTERDNISLPATGLMVFNTTVNDGEINIGTPSVPRWIGTKRPQSPMVYSVTEGSTINTESTRDSMVTGMNLRCAEGTYIASFNGQHTGVAAQKFSSDQGVIDLVKIYDELIAFDNGSVQSHMVTFGSDEVLPPGVYDVPGAASIAGRLTLDGGGDSSSIFIIRCEGAFSAGANSNVILQGDAKPENIFWVATGSSSAMTVGEYSSVKGNLVSNAGAVTIAANANLEGRMFSKTGALSVGSNSVLTIPEGDSFLDLRSLSSFVMFSSNGAVTSDATSIVTGDVGNAVGAITLAGAHYGGQFPAGTEPIIGTEKTTYSIYQNGVEVPYSSRVVNSLSSVISLQAMITLTTTEHVDVRWKVESGEATLNHRNLTLIRSEN